MTSTGPAETKKHNGPPRTLAECDKELMDYRKALRLTSVAGRVAVWEQIDRILEIRHRLARGGSGNAVATVST